RTVPRLRALLAQRIRVDRRLKGIVANSERDDFDRGGDAQQQNFIAFPVRVDVERRRIPNIPSLPQPPVDALLPFRFLESVNVQRFTWPNDVRYSRTSSGPTDRECGVIPVTMNLNYVVVACVCSKPTSQPP